MIFQGPDFSGPRFADYPSVSLAACIKILSVLTSTRVETTR